MTEEIYIDGVNVTGCKNYVHIEEERYKPECNCRLTTVDRGYYCDPYATSVCEEEECEYKQIKRLEQENFALTQESQQKSQTICELKQENKKLNKKIQILNKNSYTTLREMTVLDAELDEVGFMNNKYRSALEEIKNNFMCFRSCMIPFHIGNKENLPHNMADVIQNYCESIINKINEVLQ